MPKICSKCGAESSNEIFWCTNCNAKFIQDVPKEIDEELSRIEKSENNTEKEKRSYHSSQNIFWSNPLEINKKNIVGIFAIIVILALLVSSFVLPWYSLNIHTYGDLSIEELGGDVGISNYVDSSYQIDFLLSGIEYRSSYKSTFTGLHKQNTPSFTVDYNDDNALKEPMNMIFSLTIILLIVTVISFSLFLALIYKKIRKIVVIVVFAVLAILTLAALVNFVIAIPNGLNENLNNADSLAGNLYNDVFAIFNYNGQFVGSSTSSMLWTDLGDLGYYSADGFANINVSWGPSFGWFVLLFSAILSIVCLFISITWVEDK